jgi:hypothetical protein
MGCGKLTPRINFLSDQRLIIQELNGTTQRFCIIYQVDFSNVKLPHLGMN